MQYGENIPATSDHGIQTLEHFVLLEKQQKSPKSHHFKDVRNVVEEEKGHQKVIKKLSLVGLNLNTKIQELH